MLIKIQDAPEELVQTLKEITGAQTGSKAFLHAAELMLKLDALTDKQSDEIFALRRELEQHRILVRSLQQSAQSIVELAAKDPKTIKIDGDDDYAWWVPEETATGS